ncbi:MAG: MlaA family lipoprotein, partial [Pseudomonadota bacterium]
MMNKKNVKSLLSTLLVTTLLTGCASTKNTEVSDPLEGVNRGIFAFNNVVDNVILEPAAKGYKAALPKPARVGVRNV